MISSGTPLSWRSGLWLAHMRCATHLHSVSALSDSDAQPRRRHTCTGMAGAAQEGAGGGEGAQGGQRRRWLQRAVPCLGLPLVR
jgi:hypothetical protein